MTKAQHTPGPWKAGNVDNIGHGFLVWSEGNGCDVATVKLERDRHLIAAAPAMLAALESIGAEIEAWADDENPDGAQSPNELAARLAIKARAAIAAARGTPTGEGGHPIPAAQQGEGGQ